MAKNKKLIATVAAVATSAALLLGGTLAWQSANQTALNEASDVINPGGRLHDDFDGTNKDVYVENFAEDPIFARVRLEEYFEIITNYTEDGAAPEKVHPIVGEKVVPEDGADLTGKNVRYKADGTTPLYVREYETHIFTEEGMNDAAVKTEDDGTSYAWWNWQLGGETVYMPTFNLNKDSLLADVNGVFNGAVGTITDKNQNQYETYVEYADGATASGYEVYDGDPNDADEIDLATLKAIIENGNAGYEAYVETVEATHEVKPTTYSATLMSMQEWIDAGSQPGPYWVYDTDGWVYWAQAIPGGETTGLLLDGIKLNQVMDDTWYYAINVVAQFITADDMGKTDGTGFYADDETVSPQALELLKAIGVEVPITTQDELQAAFEQGDTITLPDVEITSDTAKVPSGLNFSADYTWTEGGTLNGGTLNLTDADSRGLFINNEIGWPENDDVANEATINDTTINANGVSAVYVQAIDAPVNLNNVKITSDNAGLYVNMGSEPVTLTNVTIDAANNDTHAGEDYFNSAVAVANPGHVVINSGTYSGTYAAYVFSTGGTIEINGGTFNGALKEDAGELIIKGGTFTDDPTNYVDTENYDVTKNDDNTWTVSEKSAGGENNLPESKTYKIDGDFILSSNSNDYLYGSQTLKVVDLEGNEVDSANIEWSADSTDLSVTDGTVSFRGTMTAPLQEYTVTAVINDVEYAAATVYVYDSETYGYIGSVVSETSGATYYGFDYVPYDGEKKLGEYPTQICVYRAGDDPNNVYYCMETMNFNILDMSETFDSDYADPINMPLVSDITEWPATDE